MKRFLALAILATLALVVAAKEKITLVPAHCIRIDEFLKPCPAAKYGGYTCPVHFVIKPLPECAQYDHQHILRIDKPQ